ncbi:MAG: acetate/propionate family kinase [Planctomycetota bacterium]|jgi:acetate kinase
MKILVCNIGSTSFKFRLFDLANGEREIATGGADRIGGTGGELKLTVGERADKHARDFTDHGECIQVVMAELVAVGALDDAKDLDAVAFKAVMAGDCDPVVRVDDELLERMEYFVPVAPAHNPPYIAVMRMFAKVLGDTPLVAAFEPGFHRTMPDRRRYYAAPPEWAEKYGVKRYGFHGASHRYIATRMAELMPEAKRIISCHLGGSSSICAIEDGQSQGTSMGLSPQSGLPQGSRVGDLDPYSLKLMAAQTGRDLDDLLGELGSKAGMAGLSGTGGDMRDVEKGAAGGNERCQLALDVYVTAIRDYIGAFLVELGGADAIVFTGGIGQRSEIVRGGALAGLEFAGVIMDAVKNGATHGEGRMDAAGSKTAIWAVETNEELIVARQAAELLSS